MLLRFGVSNYLSIKDRQELSMVASSSLKDDESGLIIAESLKDRLVPAAIVYGANASGKTSILTAFSTMCRTILLSHSMLAPQQATGALPFALDPESLEKPTTFDVDFVMHGQRYSYNFAMTAKTVVSEEFVAYPRGRPQLWFSRIEQNFDFGKGMTGRNRVIADLVRPNSLFFSAANQNDHDLLSPVARFFYSAPILWGASALPARTRRYAFQDEIDERAIQFLDQIGSGIVGQKIMGEGSDRFNTEEAATLSSLSSLLGGTEVGQSKRNLQFAHLGKSGKRVYFHIDQESSGTRRLLELLPEIYRSLDTGALLVVDELDASLHTKACEAILGLFSSPKTNPYGAQLVATTHDTNLLRSPLLRRDQIWFTEKNTEGATELYPLSDFRSRQTDNFEQGYLQGRYGAIPFAGSARELIESM